MSKRKDRVGRKVTAFFKRKGSWFAKWRTHAQWYFLATVAALHWAHTADAAEGVLQDLGMFSGSTNVVYWTLMFLLNRLASRPIAIRSPNAHRRKPKGALTRRRISGRKA